MRFLFILFVALSAISAKSEMIAPNSKILFVFSRDFYERYKTNIPILQKEIRNIFDEKYYVKTNFIFSVNDGEIPQKELEEIRDKYKNYQYFILFGETSSKYFLKLMDYKLATFFIKSESNYNQPPRYFLRNALSQYQGEIFFGGNVIKAESPNTILIKAETAQELKDRAVYIYPSIILSRNYDSESIPRGVILERVGAFHRVQVINPENIPITTGDHVKILKSKVQTASSQSLKKKLKSGSGNVEEFDVTYLKFNYVFPFQYSFFQCSLLPIVTNVKNESIKDVRANILDEMKDDEVCQIKVNDDVEELLEKRKKTLNKDLYNSKVLKTIANKLKAGSLIRLSVLSKGAGFFVKMEVLVQDGKTVVWKRSTVLSDQDINGVENVALIWLKDYQETIPYIGLVDEVVGDQLLLTIGEEQDTGNVQHYEIFRPEAIKIESFEDIYKVTWEKKKLGNGTLKNIKGNSAIAFIRNLEPGQKVQKGDWVLLNKDLILDENDPLYLKHNVKIGREKGRVKLAVEGSELKADNTTETSNWFGIDIGMDYYLPYSLVGIFSFKRIFGSGSFSSSASFFDGAVGYALKPPIKLVSFMDLIAGYKRQQYNLSGIHPIFGGDFTISGPYIGLRFELPIYRILSIQSSVKIAPIDSAKNTNTTFGSIDKAHSYSFEITPIFKFNKKWGAFSSLTYQTHEFEYGQGVTQGLNIFVGNLGVTYSF